MGWNLIFQFTSIIHWMLGNSKNRLNLTV